MIISNCFYLFFISEYLLTLIKLLYLTPKRLGSVITKNQSMPQGINLARTEADHPNSINSAIDLKSSEFYL